MFQEKIKMNRKKNLSSKIIVDEYDHLIKNSKIQPNFESFMEPPLSPHFNQKDFKFTVSKQQSSQSQYSMQNISENTNNKECFKCGEFFSYRIYESHQKICEHKFASNKKQDNRNFNKKDEYNFFPANLTHRQEGKLNSARNHNRNTILPQQKQFKKVQLKKSNSKISIQSHDKNSIKRPTSSTRNKLDIKGHQNLKQKILSKLEGNRHKNTQIKEEFHKKVNSQNKHTLSNSKPKSTSKNISRLQNSNKKFNTMNSSSINKKNVPNRGINYEFNRSEVLGNTSADQKKKEKAEFISKASIKQEKKNTLKKKTINSNNSFVLGQPFQRQKQKSKRTEDFNYKENSSYFSQSHELKNKVHQQKQHIKQGLRKQGLFRRQSSNQASKRKFHKEHEHEMMQQKPLHHRNVNDEYFFFENHPSSVPSHVTKRQERLYSKYQNEEEEMFQDNSSNIIRNKLGLNKNGAKNKPQLYQRLSQLKGKIPKQNLLFEHKEYHPKKEQIQKQSVHYRNSRQNYQQSGHVHNNNQNTGIGHIKRNQQRPQQRVRSSQENINLQRQNQQTRQRPSNPMGITRNTSQRRQNVNRPQNRAQPRIQNERIHSQNIQRQNIHEPVRNQNRNNPQQQNRRYTGNRRPQQRRRQNPNPNPNRQNTSNRRQPGQQNNGRIQQDTLNFISNTLNEQFEVMNEHFNLLNNIFSNFSNIVNVNITASTSNQNPTTFVFRSHGRRRNNNRQNQEDGDSSQTHSEYSDFSSDFSDDESMQNQTDYSEDEYYYEEEENEHPGMTEYQINSIPVLRYSKQKHGSNQCTICLVELNQNEHFKKLYCDHVFHTECIDEWLKRKNACPVCRDQMGVRN